MYQIFNSDHIPKHLYPYTFYFDSDSHLTIALIIIIAMGSVVGLTGVILFIVKIRRVYKAKTQIRSRKVRVQPHSPVESRRFTSPPQDLSPK